jgi:hypothetical protein
MNSKLVWTVVIILLIAIAGLLVFKFVDFNTNAQVDPVDNLVENPQNVDLNDQEIKQQELESSAAMGKFNKKLNTRIEDGECEFTSKESAHQKFWFTAENISFLKPKGFEYDSQFLKNKTSSFEFNTLDKEDGFAVLDNLYALDVEIATYDKLKSVYCYETATEKYVDFISGETYVHFKTSKNKFEENIQAFNLVKGTVMEIKSFFLFLA